ncbi:KH domain-containing protein [Kitasatospora sp. NPDC050543]|uniref:KH domain-containing protein n=1 Tax=Kitasatospora sp. NPDC050543 TaxID=3364054 RepID=UPI00378B37BA
MSDYLAGQVEAALDLRSWGAAIGGQDDLVALWSQLEPTLYGRPLRGGAVHSWDADHGTIRLEILRVAPGVTVLAADTRIDLVAVREPARLVHRCATCDRAGRAGYGVFHCRACGDAGQPDQVCVDHAVMLDGALTPSCPEHHPRCRDCDTAAVFWCAGVNCRARAAWCARHRARHPQDPDTDYCPGCYRLAFPVCEEQGCSSVGTVTCDWLGPHGKPCGQQACTRHARRWQVFGAERVGLGLCRNHSRIAGRPADELLYQICAGAARTRGVRVPSLPAFGHNLRNCGHRELAVDYRTIRAKLEAVRSRSAAGNGSAALTAALERAAVGWERELQQLRGHAAEGEQLLQRLQRLLLDQDPRWGREIAAGLSLQEYKPARTGGTSGDRAALLWVQLPDELHRYLIGPQGTRIKSYSQQLGAEVKLADRNRRGRR